MERIMFAMLRVHLHRSATYRRFVALSVLAVAGMVSCMVHRWVEDVVDLPVNATAVLALCALALGVLEAHALKRASDAMEELRRQHRIARLRIR